ncbi:PAS domain S-box protein [Neobacillus mesonae]|uniref:PAS domain S-box protein n=1 Tax=Neobacillus mesonae TaxID=1193713 RepID=UPI00204145D0|nr:PAS domain S-box protein [Neobacillus mesonae]MCM3571093.1 PAS domain S-box protein [Neobacillus mesonae]
METATEKLTHPTNFIKKSNNPPSNKVNILMVDDCPENLLALEAVLISPNYHLVRANSGKEALKCMLKQDFAVILLDVQMPGLNGFETAKLIKTREKTKHIPIIFITAISQNMEHVLQGYEAGAIDYIFKPFQPETLRKKVEQFVEIHQNHVESLQQTVKERTESLHKKLGQATYHLRRSEALSKAIGETILDTIIVFDADGSILSANPAVKSMFGYEEEEIIGRHVCLLIIEPDDGSSENSRHTWLSSMKQSAGKVMESTAYRKDESCFYADILIGQTMVENQQIFVCTIRDITERKQMEKVKKAQLQMMERMVSARTIELTKANKELQKEIEERKRIADHLYRLQERFQKIFEASPCLMAICSQEEFIFTDVNSSWLNLTGYQRHELINQKIKEDHFIDEATGRPILLEQKNLNKKIHYQTKTGEIREGLLSTEIIDIASKPCMLVVLTDMTEQAQLEKQLSRLDRLNLIGEMAAGIAHEIRNPMTTVQGFLQIARESSERVSSEIIDIMLEELARANSIISEFLNLAKNKISMKKKQNLNTILGALSPLIQAEALRSRKYVKLNLNECPDILLDEKEIRQLILNVALNGIDAMAPNGKLTIKTFVEKDKVILEIKDQGEGIPSEIMEKIGTPFFTTKEKGTGLGLAICFSVAKRHHAEIDIETGNEGTTFSVRFPCDS